MIKRRMGNDLRPKVADVVRVANRCITVCRMTRNGVGRITFANRLECLRT